MDTVSDIRRGDKFVWAGKTYLAVADARPNLGGFDGFMDVNFLPGSPRPAEDGAVHQGGSLVNCKAIKYDHPVEIMERDIPVVLLHEEPSGDDTPEVSETPGEAALRRLAWVERTRTDRNRELAAANEGRDDLVRIALLNGISVPTLMKETGLSRARIYQIRDHRR